MECDIWLSVSAASESLLSSQSPLSNRIHSTNAGNGEQGTHLRTTVSWWSSLETPEKPVTSLAELSIDGTPTSSQSSPPSSLPSSSFSEKSYLGRTGIPTSTDCPSSNGESIINLPTEALLKKCLWLAQEVPHGQCRKCWHERNVSGPQHYTFNCTSGILKQEPWKQFKKSTRFRPSQVCWYCFSPLQHPFSHPTGVGGGKGCEYPDALKEFCFLIWADVETRIQVFQRLQTQAPVNLQAYTNYLIRKTSGGSFGLVATLAAYASIREQDQILW